MLLRLLDATLRLRHLPMGELEIALQSHRVGVRIGRAAFYGVALLAKGLHSRRQRRCESVRLGIR